MSGQQFSALVNRVTNFIAVQNLKIFISQPYNIQKGATAPTIELTSTDSVTSIPGGYQLGILRNTNINDDTTLYEGTLFDFGGSNIYFLKEEVTFPAPGTGLNNIEDVDFESVVGSSPFPLQTFDYSTYIPLFSADSLNFTDGGEIINTNNFSSGLDDEKAKIGLSRSADISGTRVIGDPGLLLIQQAKETGEAIDFVIVYPNCRGFAKFTAVIGDAPQQNAVNDFQKITISLGLTGVKYQETLTEGL